MQVSSKAESLSRFIDLLIDRKLISNYVKSIKQNNVCSQHLQSRDFLSFISLWI